MANQISKGKKVLEEIKTTHNKVVRLHNKAKCLVKEAEQLETHIKNLVKYLDKTDTLLYQDQLKKINERIQKAKS